MQGNTRTDVTPGEPAPGGQWSLEDRLSLRWPKAMLLHGRSRRHTGSRRRARLQDPTPLRSGGMRDALYAASTGGA
eukprot:10623841-Lingulodinium_polyedra.AAC.1